MACAVLFLNIDDAEVSMQHEEHWAINVPDSTPMHIGQEIYVCPTHICPCVAPASVLLSRGYSMDIVEARGRSRRAIEVLRELVLERTLRATGKKGLERLLPN